MNFILEEFDVNRLWLFYFGIHCCQWVFLLHRIFFSFGSDFPNSIFLKILYLKIFYNFLVPSVLKFLQDISRGGWVYHYYVNSFYLVLYSPFQIQDMVVFHFIYLFFSGFHLFIWEREKSIMSGRKGRVRGGGLPPE